MHTNTLSFHVVTACDSMLIFIWRERFICSKCLKSWLEEFYSSDNVKATPLISLFEIWWSQYSTIWVFVRIMIICEMFRDNLWGNIEHLAQHPSWQSLAINSVIIGAQGGAHLIVTEWGGPLGCWLDYLGTSGHPL